MISAYENPARALFTCTPTEARLAEPATARKVISEAAPAGTEPDPPETSTAYQAIVNTCNQHPGRAFRARELLASWLEEEDVRPFPAGAPHRVNSGRAPGRGAR
jgi:hypothetical protein